jgi:hypothetical protein
MTKFWKYLILSNSEYFNLSLSSSLKSEICGPAVLPFGFCVFEPLSYWEGVTRITENSHLELKVILTHAQNEQSP